MKVLVWTLIEIITLFVFTGSLFIWLKHRLKKETAAGDELPTPSRSLQAQTETLDKGADNYQESTATLKQFIQNQMKQAAKQLSLAKSQEKAKKVIIIKLWGTLLKAETRVLDSPEKDDTEEILKQHLASILQSIFNAKKDNANIKGLELRLIKLTQSATQSNEILRLKSELERAQNTIKKELLVQISSLEGALSRLDIKRHEQAHLELTLSNASTNIDQLKKTLEHLEHDNEFEPLMTTSKSKPSLNEIKHDLEKHRANKQITALNQIANRQQIVIDLLRDKLKEASKEELINIDESQEVAISRIEQMIKESDSLILQLENELSSTSLSIDTLKSDIDIKSKQIISSEQQLLTAQKTALVSFRESAKKQQSKVDDMKQQLSKAPENTKLATLIKEQQKESSTLEALLKESETCVTVLESELASAKKNNQEMLHTIETVDPHFRGETSSSTNNKFQHLENLHHTLLAEHSQIKQQLLASIANDIEAGLRNDVNRKKLEIDRLQLAINDLEQKQLDNPSNQNPLN